jgi:SAM-dependent methyltransferase
MPTTSWVTKQPLESPFALPYGLRGRLAGRFMLWSNRQDELLPVLDVRPGEHVLEVGYGPGGLIRLLNRTTAGRISGVDPSPDMRAMARRHAGDADLRLGSADDTGFPDDGFDCVVSVNNVALWPDLGTALDELRRVTRPSGRLVIAWHGGTAPSFIGRRLRLPEEILDRVRDALHDRFAEVARRELTRLTIFTAARPRPSAGPRESSSAG